MLSSNRQVWLRALGLTSAASPAVGFGLSVMFQQLNWQWSIAIGGPITIVGLTLLLVPHVDLKVLVGPAGILSLLCAAVPFVCADQTPVMASLRVNVEPAIRSPSGKPLIFSRERILKLNFRIINDGPEIASNFYGDVRMMILDSSITAERIDERFESEFRDFLESPFAEVDRDLYVNDSKWVTLGEDSPLSLEQHDAIIRGDQMIFFMGVFRFSDSGGQHTKRVCRYLQPPRHRAFTPVFHLCPRNNSTD